MWKWYEINIGLVILLILLSVYTIDTKRKLNNEIAVVVVVLSDAITFNNKLTQRCMVEHSDLKKADGRFIEYLVELDPAAIER